MRVIKITNLTHPLTRPLKADYCQSFWCRLRGLTFRKTLPPDWGLLLVQARENQRDAAIHMFFMQVDLAVVWINAAGKVVDVRPAYKWKSMIVPKAPAKFVLELPLERLADFQIDDEVVFT